MNFVCAMMLLFMGEALREIVPFLEKIECLSEQFQAIKLKTTGEEEAFWVLSVVCEDYFSESYTLDMAGASIDSVVLEEACAAEGSSGELLRQNNILQLQCIVHLIRSPVYIYRQYLLLLWVSP